ncbi:MAG: TonB-dependent receptor, partial [Bacteroidaceae bacterium]|nr:TonB-dependent receptor [Bacteroidaceae bacterium]
ARLVPGLYMPAYGSRLTAATYIRGVGSRSGSPAVGLYVDGMPVAEKSAYDFGFADVERVEVMRGPQGTLYGRGAMGGLIRVTTADPLTSYGTSLDFTATTRGGGRRIAGHTYLHANPNLAFSLDAFHEGQRGFFRNTTLDHKADRGNATGLKAAAAWQPQERLRFDLGVNYQYSDERSNPYRLDADPVTSLPTGDITQNRQSRYYRNLLSSGLTVAYTAPRFTLSSITAHQFLADRLFMDQDFTAADLFSLAQRQRVNTLSEEIILKSHSDSRWQHTTGLFGLWQDTRTSCPVTFYDEGVAYLNQQMAGVFANVPHAMSLTFDGAQLPFTSRLNTPSWNAALYHQSTLRDLLLPGLSLTLGLRLDYDRQRLSLASTTAQPVPFTYAMPQYHVNAALTAQPDLCGTMTEDTWQLLPKAALQYDLPGGAGNVYASLAKGYRSGGYNIQNYSDLAETALRREMMLGVRDYVLGVFDALPLPDAVKQQHVATITSMLDPNIPASPELSALRYEPETSWNYEIGTHLNFFGGALQVDGALYWIETHGLQLSRFAESGFGRVLVNAGRSRSLGGEVEARASLADDRLSLRAAYGYTHAVFTRYDLGQNGGVSVDYTDNRVPFSPNHTLSASASYRQPLTGFVTALSLGADADATGRIYWDEANTMGEPFRLLVGTRLGVELRGGVSLALWGRNLTARRYATFRFVNMGRTLSQSGLPRHFGIDVSVRL